MAKDVSGSVALLAAADARAHLAPSTDVNEEPEMQDVSMAATLAEAGAVDVALTGGLAPSSGASDGAKADNPDDRLQDKARELFERIRASANCIAAVVRERSNVSPTLVHTCLLSLMGLGGKFSCVN